MAAASTSNEATFRGPGQSHSLGPTSHDVALAEGSAKRIGLKRRADDAHDGTGCVADVQQKNMLAEEERYNSLGYLGDLVKDTTEATRALAYGVPDREFSEVRYLQEALKKTIS